MGSIAAPVRAAAAAHPTMAKAGVGLAAAGSLALAGSALLGCGSGSGSSAGHDAIEGGMRVSRSTSSGEQATGLPLDGTKEVVYSTPVGKLEQGDELVTRLELGMTNDVASRTRQDGALESAYDTSEYRYDTQVEGKLIVGDSPDDTTGPELVDERGRVVSPRQHHGSLQMGGTTRIDEQLATDRPAYVNFVADGRVPGNDRGPKECHSRSTTTYDGASDFGDDCELTVDEDHGQLHALKLTPGAGPFTHSRDSVSGSDGADSIACPSGPGSWPDVDVQDQVVMSLPVGDVEKGEILDVRGMVRAQNELDGSVLLRGGLILADGPQRIGGEAISSSHGENVLAGESLDYGRQGTIEIQHDAKDQYVNFIAYAGLRGCEKGSKLDVDQAKGSIEVDRYTPTGEE